MSEPTIIQKDTFAPQREVSFFLRLHRHLPDSFCGASAIGDCKYRPDAEPINGANQPVTEMQKDPSFVAKEKEVREAVAAKWREMGW